MKSLLCIGRLIKLELVEPDSDRVATLRFRDKWLASNGRDLYICTVRGVRHGHVRLPGGVLAKHRKFHGAPPKGRPFLGDNPTKTGTTKTLGLVKALVYTVPRVIDSPGKNPYVWHHAFGDTGHEGKEYPKRVMPALLKDAKGNLFFKRRPGNIYRVDQWLRG